MKYLHIPFQIVSERYVVIVRPGAAAIARQYKLTLPMVRALGLFHGRFSIVDERSMAALVQRGLIEPILDDEGEIMAYQATQKCDVVCKLMFFGDKAERG